jgi:NAD(P)-dependent dehydrogenase (short-subunit alcohol dehydrogenase family)
MSEGSVFIVTGAAGGVGAETVAGLARRGANVLAVDLDREALELVVDGMRGGGEVLPHCADVTDSESVAQFVDAAIARWGKLDGILNNAGIEGHVGSTILDYPDEEFERVLRINVRSVWLGMKHAIPALLRSGGGSIVNTGSEAGVKGAATFSAYVASKHAVVGLTRTVALEFASSGVRVNALCPGPTDTGMLSRIGDGDYTRFEEGIPLGRVGRPEEIGSVAAWLLLDSPAFMTGSVVSVDGGRIAG